MTEPLIPDMVADHTSCLLIKLGQVMFRVSEDRLAALGLRTRHFMILKVLAGDQASSQLELGTRLRIDSTTMVAAIDHLEAAGLAARIRDHRDRRRFLVEITEQGRRTVERADELVGTLNDELFDGLDPDERAHLRRALLTMNSGTALPLAYDAVRQR
ncbi:MarR family winged helix-turn-helix transcriptional regulator [Nocardia sp. NPDC058633]|uniref:MarR family winged helix-turn-helix transcriptional regulator n=1 Tax=Nocardia sp. NPDC058633 TaxID=3346568 RepID=UPI00365AD71C